MFYNGRLRVAGDPGEGIPVDLSLDDVYVDLRSDGEVLGRWRMDVVEVSRLEGNDFRLLLDGEDMVFQASDPLGFTYNAVATIEDISSRLRKRRRGVFRRRTEPEMLRGEPVDEAADLSEGISDLDSLLPPDERVARPPVEEPVFEEFDLDFEEEVGPAVSFSNDEDSYSIAGSPQPVESFDAEISEDSRDAESEPIHDEMRGETVDPVAFEEQHPSDAPTEPAAPLEPTQLLPEIAPTSELEIEAASDDVESLPMAPPDVEPLEPDTAAVEPLEAEPEVETPEVEEPHEPAPTHPGETAPTPAKGKRRGLLRRGRTEQDHVHQYNESRTVGGITRRVCSLCGHVSFAGEDVYGAWDE